MYLVKKTDALQNAIIIILKKIFAVMFCMQLLAFCHFLEYEFRKGK